MYQQSEKYTSGSPKVSCRENTLLSNSLNLVRNIIKKLANNEILEAKYKDHKLIGKYAGFRECHIKPNLLLIYKKENKTLILMCIALGSHSDLF